jgi:hypothetical protein
MTVSSPLFDTAGNRVGHLDVHGAVTAFFPNTHTGRGQFDFTATLHGAEITATGVVTFSDQTTGSRPRSRAVLAPTRRQK